MSTVEAMQWVWDQKWAIGIFWFPAVFIAVCAAPDFMRREPPARRRFLRRVAAFALLLVIASCFLAATRRGPFWRELLESGTGRGSGMFIWGLIAVSVTIVFFFAELAARERERKRAAIKKP